LLLDAVSVALTRDRALLRVFRFVRVVSSLVGFVLGPVGAIFGLGGSVVRVLGRAVAGLSVGTLGGL